jgi:hypothetical protein
MQANEAWIALFRRIPTELQENLALGLTTGAEIVVQKIVKLDADFMIIRGRLAGTQDTGRLVMVPYPQLTFVAIARILKDPEIEAIFGKGAAPAVVEMPTPEAEAPAAAETPAEPAPVSEPPPPVAPPKKPPTQVSKSVLLAKVRERLKEPRSHG